jgi:hypothetical protein
MLIIIFPLKIATVPPSSDILGLKMTRIRQETNAFCRSNSSWAGCSAMASAVVRPGAFFYVELVQFQW